MKEKLKNSLTISEKDKKLLVYVFAFLIIFIAYFVGYQNLSASLDTSTKQVTELTKKKKDLQKKNDNKAKYESDTLSLQSDSSKLLKTFENGTSQPATLQFLNTIESSTGVWIKSITFSDPVAVYTFGQKASSNPSNTSGSAYQTNNVGYKETINLSYEGTYAEWKNLIGFINNYEKKNTIEALTTTYNEATDVVTGTMTLALYSITGNGREFSEPKFDLKTGTDNIFAKPAE